MDVEPEEKFPLPSPHPGWPSQGGIELQHVSAAYGFVFRKRHVVTWLILIS
jgi:hypothetical protein